MSRLKELYKNEIMDAMTKKFGYKNVMEVPKLDKIVINMGVGEAKENAKLLDAAIADMELITGQKAIATKAKKSVDVNFDVSYNKEAFKNNLSQSFLITDVHDGSGLAPPPLYFFEFF